MYTASDDQIVEILAIIFPSFGGGKTSEWNPIANALADRPPQFAAGVDIATVVAAVSRHRHGFHPYSTYYINRHGDARQRLVEVLPCDTDETPFAVCHFRDGAGRHRTVVHLDSNFRLDFDLASEADIQAFLP